MSTYCKLLLDTNFFIRFFTGDIPTQQQECILLVQQIQLGKLKPYLSSIVILESNYILSKMYHVAKPQLQTIQKAMLELRGVTILENTHTSLALHWHQKNQVKLADCLIATQLKTGMVLCTYDQEFKKLPDINSQTPAEILQNL